MRSLVFTLAITACSVPPLDVTGKTCTRECPAPHACQAGLCVAPGGRLCAALPEPPHACFDFEGSTTVDARQEVRNGQLTVDTASRRFGANSLDVSITGTGGVDVARLSVPVPADWQRIAASWDVQPGAASDGISLGELLCSGAASYTGVWLFFEGSPARAVLRTDATSNPIDLQPSVPEGSWTRVSLDLERQSLAGTVRIGGQQAATATVADCGGPWTVEIGISGRSAFSAAYDDAVVTISR